MDTVGEEEGKSYLQIRIQTGISTAGRNDEEEELRIMKFI